MALPNPVFVSPSTTFVQVDQLQNPYSPVFLDSIQYTGQTVSFTTTISSQQILQNPILISTTSNQSFQDGTTSTLINQPQGFLTLQAVLPSTYTVLNSFPFRNQQQTLYNLTTSTLYTAAISSIQANTSFLQVENLLVQGTFFQSSGLILNTNISTLGTVDFQSSISIYGNVFFSSQMNISGAVSLYSSLRIRNNLTILSSLQIFSTVNVSGSLSVVSSISTSKITLQNGLIGKLIEVQQSTLDAMNIGGSMGINGSLLSFSTVQSGSSFTTKSLYTAASLQVRSSISIFGSAVARDKLFISGFTSTLGNFQVANALQIGGNLDVQSSILHQGSLQTQADLRVQGLLSTSILEAKQIALANGLREMNPFENHIDRLFVEGSGQSYDLNARSTFVGGTVSTGSDYINLKQMNISSSLFIGKRLLLNDTLYTTSNINVLRSTVIRKDIYSFSNLNGDSLDIRDRLFLNGGTVQSNLRIYGDLDIQGFLFISSISLQSSIVANNFTVSSLLVGYKGISQSNRISSLYASSITNYTPTSDEILNLQGTLYAGSLSTSLLSSLQLQLSSTVPSSFLKVSNGLGIGISTSNAELAIQKTTYATNDVYAFENISTGTVLGTNIIGNFFGDGRLLSNVAFPSQFAVSTLGVSSIAANSILASNLYASTGIVHETLRPFSTLRVGNLNIFGNSAGFPILLSTPFMATTANNSNLLEIQNMNIYRNEGLGGNFNAVYINQGYTNTQVQSIQNSNVKLFVDGIFRFDDIVSPSFSLTLETLRTGPMHISTIFPFINATQTNSTVYGTLYLSSGSLGVQPNATFLIPEGQRVASISTSIIQPIQSTLIFNSTLFVRQDTAQVGINTMPNFELDVPRTTLSRSTLEVQQSTFVYGQMQQQEFTENIWLLQNTSFDYLYWSSNPFPPTSGFENIWKTFPFGPIGVSDFFDIQYGGVSGNQWLGGVSGLFSNPGRGLYTRYGNNPSNAWIPIENAFVNSNMFKKLSWNGNVWVAYTIREGNNYILYSYDSFNWSEATVNIDPTKFFGEIRRFAWNGSMWVASCLFAGILYSSNAREWFSTDAGGFGLYPYILSVTWADNQWIAVGSPYSTGDNKNFAFSRDGINWTSSNLTLSVSSVRLANTDLPVISSFFLYDIDYDGSVLCGSGQFLTLRTFPTFQYIGYLPSLFYSKDYGQTWSIGPLSGVDPFGYDYLTNPNNIPAFIGIRYGGGAWISWGPSQYGAAVSRDAINWNLTFYCSGCIPVRASMALGYSSNPFPSLRPKSQSTFISFYENPVPLVPLTAPSSPFISYSPSSFRISDALFIDSYRNIGVGLFKNSPNSYSTGSTFFQYGDGNISTFLSTQLLYASEYRLGIQNI